MAYCKQFWSAATFLLLCVTSRGRVTSLTTTSKVALSTSQLHKILGNIMLVAWNGGFITYPLKMYFIDIKLVILQKSAVIQNSFFHSNFDRLYTNMQKLCEFEAVSSQKFNECHKDSPKKLVSPEIFIYSGLPSFTHRTVLSRSI